ncbi:MAG: hypothetical protein Q7K43_03425 [Candidatus Woesearchaeota archaeon]|nr:hypothetical protein [Candidatus Woesearchaeota archaeon]
MGFLRLFSQKKQNLEFKLPPLPPPPQLSMTNLPSDIAPIHAGQDTQSGNAVQSTRSIELPDVPELQKPFLLEPVSEPSMQKTKTSEFQEVPEQIRATVRPMFVSTDDYKQILSGANMIRTKLEQADHIMNQLTTLKNQQEQFFERWRTQLEDAEKKLTYLDTVLDNAR